MRVWVRLSHWQTIVSGLVSMARPGRGVLSDAIAKPKRAARPLAGGTFFAARAEVFRRTKPSKCAMQFRCSSPTNTSPITAKEHTLDGCCATAHVWHPSTQVRAIGNVVQKVEGPQSTGSARDPNTDYPRLCPKSTPGAQLASSFCIPAPSTRAPPSTETTEQPQKLVRGLS